MTMSLIHASTLPSTIGYGLLSFVAAIIIFKTLVASCSSFFDVSLLYTVSYFVSYLGLIEQTSKRVFIVSNYIEYSTCATASFSPPSSLFDP
ncbi:hypothetical protein JOL62DRAFT_588677 [Phyllosticta paracitricarpa]|uniref:Uncharacterized protein n=1 Tax=Phyllosticta paracitricarpa TaxID=2016321 RepID=A0ABR1MVV9_9PEZI